MDNPDLVSDDDNHLISEIELGWTLEYYFVENAMLLRETSNGRSLEQPIADALRRDPFERAAHFGGIEF